MSTAEETNITKSTEKILTVPPLALNKPPNYSKTLLLKGKSAQASKVNSTHESKSNHQHQHQHLSAAQKKINRQLLEREQVIVKKFDSNDSSSSPVATSLIVLQNNRKSYTKYALPSHYGVRYPLPAEPQQNKASALRQQHQTGQFARINTAFEIRKQREHEREKLLEDLRRQQHDKYVRAASSDERHGNVFRRSATDCEAVKREERRNAELRRQFQQQQQNSMKKRLTTSREDETNNTSREEYETNNHHRSKSNDGERKPVVYPQEEDKTKTQKQLQSTSFHRSQSAPTSGLTGVYHHDHRNHHHHQKQNHIDPSNNIFLVRPSPSSIPQGTPRNLHQISNNYYKNEIYLLEDEERRKAKEERDHFIRLYGLEAIQKLEQQEGGDITNIIASSSASSPNSLHRMLIQERRRQTILMEKQRVLLSRQAQRIHLAQELHRLRTKGLLLGSSQEESGSDDDDNNNNNNNEQGAMNYEDNTGYEEPDDDDPPQPQPCSLTPQPTIPDHIDDDHDVLLTQNHKMSQEEIEVMNETAIDDEHDDKNNVDDDVWKRPSTSFSPRPRAKYTVIKHQHLHLQEQQQRWASETGVVFADEEEKTKTTAVDITNSAQKRRQRQMLEYYFSSPPPSSATATHQSQQNNNNNNNNNTIGEEEADRSHSAPSYGGGGGGVYFFPEQPHLPLDIPANISLRDPEFMHLSPRKDGGVELSPTSKRKLLLEAEQQQKKQAMMMRGKVHNNKDENNINGSFASTASTTTTTICDVSTHLPKVHLSVDRNNRNNNNINTSSTSVEPSTNHHHSLHLSPPIPYYKRRQLEQQQNTSGFIAPMTSPIITPQHLRGGIVFNNNNNSNQQHQQFADVERNLVNTMMTMTTSHQNEDTDTSQHQRVGVIPSPLRRRQLQLEKQEWLSRRQIEQEQLDEGYPLSQAAKMKLIAPKLNLLSSSTTDLSSSSFLSFTPLVPPLLLYDLILSIAERAAWFEGLNNNNKNTSSSSRSSSLFSKPEQFKSSSTYYSQLWREISSKETAAIFSAQRRFAQKRRNELTPSTSSSFSPFFFLPPKSVLGPLLTAECGQIIANSFCRVNEERIKQDLIVSKNLSRIQSGSSSSSSSPSSSSRKSPLRNIEQEDYLFDQNKQKQEENDESVPAVKTIQLSFKKPTTTSTTTISAASANTSRHHHHDVAKKKSKTSLLMFSGSNNHTTTSSGESIGSSNSNNSNNFSSSTMIGRAQLQVQAAEFRAADDILWQLSQMILEPVTKKIVASHVVVTHA